MPQNVIIANKLPQTVRASVLDDAGAPYEIVLGPHAFSAPVDASKLTAHTKGLVQSGHLRLRPA